MKLSDLFRFATDNLRRRKGRTALTVIGVVVGVCAIVVMISLGIAVNRATDEMLQSWQDLTKITVYSSTTQADVPKLDDKMVQQFKGMEHVVAATPMYHGQFASTVYAGRGDRYQLDSQIIGMDPDSIVPMDYDIVAGTTLTGQSLGRNKIPVLVELQTVFRTADTRKSYMNPNRYFQAVFDNPRDNLPSNLPQFDENGNLTNADIFFTDPTKNYTLQLNYGTDPNTQEPLYKEYELVPVGFINSSNDYNVQGSFIMSIEDVKKLEKEYEKLSSSAGGSGGGGGVVMMYGMGMGQRQTGGYDSVIVKADNVDNAATVEAAIKDIGYQISSLSEWRQQLQGQVAQTQMMLGGLAAVSLFVAALNIANTMTMAIYERTKEIGVMKVLGCRLKDIRTMFLIESGAIGLIGGVIGVAVSLLLSVVLNYLPQILLLLGINSDINIAQMFGFGDMMTGMTGVRLSIIPVWLVVLALCFATGVGLLSGIAPANRAVKISSLEAIRHE